MTIPNIATFDHGTFANLFFFLQGVGFLHFQVQQPFFSFFFVSGDVVVIL